jgi:hypothetical protein
MVPACTTYGNRFDLVGRVLEVEIGAAADLRDP